MAGERDVDDEPTGAPAAGGTREGSGRLALVEAPVTDPVDAPAGRVPDRRLVTGFRHGPLAHLRGILARPLASYYLLLASSGLLVVIGLVMVFSATSVSSYATDGNAFASVSRQAIFSLVGLVAFWVFQRLPAKTYRALGLPLLVISVVLLGLLDLLGLLASPDSTAPAPSLGPIHADKVNNLWLYLGPLQLQPSELAKLAIALWAAGVLATKGPRAASLRELSVPLFPVAGIVLLMVGYNDFGTMVCLLILLVGLLWAAGVRMRHFGLLGMVALVGGAVLVIFAPYRVTRLNSFFDSSQCDPTDECYQAIHGMYAIADGGWFGVGLGEGRLKWGWLPNGHNDFIFAVIAEELGVVGCFVVLALLAVLAYTGLRIARRVDDPFRRMVGAGITVWLVGQAAINIGGVIGVLPITGLPLPFISDGGSALVVTMAAVGLLASFARAEPEAARALHARPPDRWVRLLWAPLPPLPRDGTAASPRAPRPAERARGSGGGRPVPSGTRAGTRDRRR
ncbi:MAG TPA: putative lipid II flippase FtsW [Rugosimonospora sp.]|nr:putative lipid II flippase FtsW [Rugosimonospora sp.]